MGNHVDRALLLLKQSRHELAEQELRQALAGEPNDGRAHALLAMCLAERQALDEATTEARMAIHLEPDLPYAHYVMAAVMTARHRLAEADAAIAEALRLDPYEADYHAAKAAIAFERRHWRAAADAAEDGLTVEPDHVGCTNLRAMALVQLGRRAEAGRTIDAALARDPENAFSHANQGWTLLHERQPHKAMEHFREALRIDPNLEFARAGIVEAMKARNPIYRVLLGYFLWMARLDTRVQIALVLGLVFGQNILRSLVRQVPLLAPLAPWILTAYLWVATIAYAVLLWTAETVQHVDTAVNWLNVAVWGIAGSTWLGAILSGARPRR